ncbi:MAG TPA: SRPBCC family protein [Pyrinomonadaceae bacterium]|nr:SRPBCC family protein [Pyrinomonadaceae bacterium]
MWEFQHSHECGVGREFAWRFWTEVGNWAAVDPSVERAELDGPFAAGAKGTTKPRGAGPVSWRVTEAEAPSRAVIEVPAPGASLKFIWSFEDAGGGRTLITQRIVFEGERAAEYAGAMGEELRAGAPAGMRSLCAAMSARAASLS